MSDRLSHSQAAQASANHLLFLDFDGVLHPTSAGQEELFCRLDLLEEALCGAEYGLIISSSWRHHYSLPELVDLLPAAMHPHVLGITGEPFIGRWPRYREILAFVDHFARPCSWRALDDSWIEFPAKCPELVACDPNLGMQRPQVAAIQRWLRTSGDPQRSMDSPGAK